MLRALSVQSRRGAYAALLVLTAIWGSNWIVMKLALLRGRMTGRWQTRRRFFAPAFR